MSEFREVDVLVVEDSIALSALLAQALQRKDLTTDVAGDVVEAKRLLCRGTYKVMLLDLILPDGRGQDVLDFIRRESIPRMPVLVITAAEAEVLATLDRSMVTSVFIKPVEPAQIAEFVHALTLQRASAPL